MLKHILPIYRDRTVDSTQVPTHKPPWKQPAMHWHDAGRIRCKLQVCIRFVTHDELKEKGFYCFQNCRVFITEVIKSQSIPAKTGICFSLLCIVFNNHVLLTCYITYYRDQWNAKQYMYHNIDQLSNVNIPPCIWSAPQSFGPNLDKTIKCKFAQISLASIL